MRVSATLFVAFGGDRDAENDPDFALRVLPLNYALSQKWRFLFLFSSISSGGGCLWETYVLFMNAKVVANGILVRAFGKSLTFDLVNDGNDDSECKTSLLCVVHIQNS